MAYTHLLGDAHTHLDQYAADELTGFLERAGEVGVGFIVCAGTTVASSRACVRMADQHDMLYAGVGIHPIGGAPAHRQGNLPGAGEASQV